MKISGIYRIVLRETGECYIGQSANVRSRWHDHRRLLNRGSHHCAKLQVAWSRHGAAAFDFVLVEQVHPAALDEAERALVIAERPAFNTRMDGIRGAGRGWKPGNKTRWHRAGPTMKEIAARYGVSYSVIHNALRADRGLPKCA